MQPKVIIIADPNGASVPGPPGAFNFAATAAEITKLMGKGEAAARRELMALHGDVVEVDV